MGFRYLDGKSWSQVTRDERYFCAHLFSLIRSGGAKTFVQRLNEAHECHLDDTQEWEIAYEVCFYRDLWQQHGQLWRLYSPKRTFDLCLFSDDAIVIIEAKACQQFSPEDLMSYDKDSSEVKKRTEAGTVLVAGLASSLYDAPQEVRLHFDAAWLTWRELAEFYNHDTILLRADTVYEPKNALAYGKNNIDGHMTGVELEACYANHEEFVVGRQGGLSGRRIMEDIVLGTWKNQRYETHRKASGPLNSNWFWLSELMDAITEFKKN